MIDLRNQENVVYGSVLVIGGGVAGIQSALDLGDSGFKVYLIEKSPTIGGNMARLDKTFPTNDCSTCILSPKLVEAGRHPNIELITNADVTSIEGEAGRFHVTVKERSRFVDADKCTGCGTCAEKCPTRIPSEFDQGLGMRRAIYVPFPQAVPLIYKIDKENCLFFKYGRCKICEQVCPAQAIDYEQEPEILTNLDVGAVIVATGYDVLDPGVIKEYGYGRFPNVLSSLEFERMLNASGPTGGHILRPSDSKPPKNIAFIQCVGSRDTRRGVPYCSAVCCTYSTKEAILIKEHLSDCDAEIFHMDIRTFGKGFEEYYNRAQNVYDVKYTRSRVAEVAEDPETRSLYLRYVTDEGNYNDKMFDMVVLAVGAIPPKGTDELCEVLGIDLDDYGFCKTGEFSPLETSRPGIFAAGHFISPKDIPDSVAEASGAAAKAAALISTARNTQVTPKELPPETDVSEHEPRIGVFICRCGGNIGKIVNVPEVVEFAETQPNVVFAQENMYSCSYDALEKLKEQIEEHNLNRIVIAACSHRTHEPLFQETIKEVGLNPYLFEMTNIRDQCSWVHMNEPEKATIKSIDLVEATIAKAKLNEALEKSELGVNHSALVIGAGVSGITVANDIASQGFEVNLVEREAELGGNLSSIRSVLNGEDTQEFLKSLTSEIEQNPRINVFKNSKIIDVEGYVGNYDVTIDHAGVDHSISVGAIVVATGGTELKPNEYLYGENEKVMTQFEFEEKLYNDNIDSECVVMIQCVGSREEGRPYCSRVCCTHALQNALETKRRNLGAEIYILYRDMRTYGFDEDLYTEATENGIIFIRYEPDEKPVVLENNGLQVLVKDPILKKTILLKPDSLVLSSAILPQKDNDALSKLLKVPRTENGFFLEAHMKLRPVDFATDGIFLCGLAHSPKNIQESIAQASAAAQHASVILAKNIVLAEGIIALINEDKCIGCKACDLCPYNAIEYIDWKISLKEFDYNTRKAHVTMALCKGCGKCAGTCPTGAIKMHHFTEEQIYSQLTALAHATIGGK
jgi:heterodisulfide reductase subunit A